MASVMSVSSVPKNRLRVSSCNLWFLLRFILVVPINYVLCVIISVIPSVNIY